VEPLVEAASGVSVAVAAVVGEAVAAELKQVEEEAGMRVVAAHATDSAAAASCCVSAPPEYEVQSVPVVGLAGAGQRFDDEYASSS
jgi:hypothetical protein